MNRENFEIVMFFHAKTKKEIPALLTNERISDDDIPFGFYKAELRGSDYDPGISATLEKSVSVNFNGTIIANEPFFIGGLETMALDHVVFDGESDYTTFNAGSSFINYSVDPKDTPKALAFRE